MSIKDIIAKAKSTEQATKVTSKQAFDSVDHSDDLTNKNPQDLKRKVMNFDIPAVIKNYWMGKIKSEGLTFKRIVIDTLISKYGLPDNWSEDDL